jgi:protein O-mannosyl-transferase
LTRHAAAIVVLALAVCAVYGRALDDPFIFDDRPGIIDNPSIRRLWPLVGDATAPGPLNPPPLAPTSRRPLPNYTFALNYRLGGLDPVGYRLVNVVLHVLTAVTLAAVVGRTLLLPYFRGTWATTAWPAAFAIALLWALHPLVTEAVVYVTQRTELLAALCYLTTLWAALGYWSAASASGRRGWLAVAGLASLAGMASKEVVASVPLVVLLYERTFLVRSWRAVRRSWPLHVTLALGWVLLAGLSAGGIGGLSDAKHAVPLDVWWMTQANVLFLYAKLAFWPWPLTIHYAPRFLRTPAEAWPWMLALVVATVATVRLVARRPAARFVVIAIVMVLAPTLVVPLPKMMAAERRMYLPLVGLMTLAVCGGWRAVSARATERAPAGALGGGTVVLVAVLFAAVSVARLGAYDTAVAIWRDALRTQPDDAMAHYNLGVALLDEGWPIAEAIPRFERTLELDPGHTGALDNLGMVLNRLDRPAEALPPLQRALALDADDVVALNNLGIALTKLGRPAEAVPHLERALTLDAEQPKSKTHLNLGNALLAVGRTVEALAHFEQAIALDPTDADASFNLGGALVQSGRPAEAIAPFERALALAPDDAAIRGGLASALLQAGQGERAAEEYRRALARDPANATIRSNLGTALQHLGRREDALAAWREAIRLDPTQANAQLNLGRALLEAGRAAEAVAPLRAAVRLRPDDAMARMTCAQALAESGERAEALAMAEQARASAHGELARHIDAWLKRYGADAAAVR